MKLADREAEHAVLGAALLSDTVLPRLIVDEGLTPADFAEGRNRDIYTAMLALHDQGVAIDPLTVARHIGADPNTVDALAAHVPDAANVRHYARLVKKTAVRRRWQHAAQLLHEAAATDNDDLAGQAERALVAPTVTDDTYDRARLASEVSDYFNTTKPAGITTGFLELDDILAGGFRPGDTTVLAAWEAMGKSVMVSQWLALASENGHRAHLYSNDTPVRDLALRALAHMGAATWGNLARRKLTPEQADRVLKASERLPFEITDTSSWSADQIARHMRINRWDLCALDVLHNMPYRDESELRVIASTLKTAAQSAGAHLILVCHLNQERAKSEVLPAPVRRDLRGSGMLAKLAANVVFLHRTQERVGEFVETSEVTTLVADKARHGRSGDGIEVIFEPQWMRFVLPSFDNRRSAA